MITTSSVLWRQKEQFGDGVDYNWIDSLIEMTNEYTDEEFSTKQKNYGKFSSNQGSFCILKIFEELFLSVSTVTYWIPNTKWDGVNANPSSGTLNNTTLVENY